MPAASKKPNKITIRSYQMGFGDCFLMSVGYSNPRMRDRHVLIDFGSTRMPRWAGAPTLEKVAKDIRTQTGGKLDVIVATHRHKDHIQGFRGAPGRIIAELEPTLVLQPWTEDPKADPKATRAPRRYRKQRAFRSRLDDMHAMAAVAGRAAANEATAYAKGVRTELGFLGEDNLSNKEAVVNLMDLGKRPSRYLCCGDSPGTSRVLPGVKVWVLGPPSLDQYDAIRTQRREDEDEYWHFQAGAGDKAFRMNMSLFPDYEVPSTASKRLETRWFVPRLERLRGEQLLSIVRQLDKAMNNTSLILLFEIGKRRLLFSGDAQIENWEYILHHAPDSAKIRQKLRRLDFYKVGHHGSLNATPKTLWNLLEKKSEDEDAADRLKTIVSTMAGVHGKAHRRTEVPRKKLIDELETHSDHLSTQKIRGSRLCEVTELDP